MLEVSLFFSTRNRSDSLARMLGSITAADRKCLVLEIICVDNGSTDNTPQVLAELAEVLPITVLEHPRPGLSEARNKALDYISEKYAGNRLVVATDDDIIARPDWLRNLYHTATQHGPGYFFGGRIRPSFPTQNDLAKYICANWHDIAGPLYSFYDWPANTQTPPVLPFGPNMACFLDQLRPLRYDSYFGMPACIGEETDLGRSLIKSGYAPCYAYSALVEHQVRPEQMQLPWMQRRMALYGVSEARLAIKHYPGILDKLRRRLKRRIRNYYLRSLFKPQNQNERQARKLRYAGHRAMLDELDATRANGPRPATAPIQCGAAPASGLTDQTARRPSPRSCDSPGTR